MLLDMKLISQPASWTMPKAIVWLMNNPVANTSDVAFLIVVEKNLLGIIGWKQS